MRIVKFEKVDMEAHGINTTCDVYSAHIVIDDVDRRAEEMIHSISDTSWIAPLEATKKATFTATSKRTIKKLVKHIHERIEGDTLTDDFGEYMVSDTALYVLEEFFDHVKAPLAELIKARVSGNEGFDFHSECSKNTISFGEAKYSGSTSPYTNALSQIVNFIELEKDVAELVVVENFVSKKAAQNCVEGIKSYAAAFSINAQKPDLVIKNAVTSDHARTLLDHSGLYIIGVEVHDQKLD